VTRRRTLRASVAVLLGVLAVPGSILAHSPDPGMPWPLFDQDQGLTFKWKAGEVPPDKMKAPILAGAADATNSRGGSRAPTFAFAAGAASTVEYGLNVFCGVGGLACADGSNAPDSFRVAFREHGHRFDWGVLSWCQMLPAMLNGCFDVENIMLDELGHITGLGHHDNHDDESDYLDSVVQTVSHARPQVGWNAHSFGRCDQAKLQLRYGRNLASTKFSTCLDLNTVLGIFVSDTSIPLRTTVTFTAQLRTHDLAAYERLRNNNLSSRTVLLQRRAPGVTSWTTVGAMPGGSVVGTYVMTQSPTTTYDWRMVFNTPNDEGVNGSISASVRVTVTGCSSSCPQSAPSDSGSPTGGG
jgi:hypothetical protein